MKRRGNKGKQGGIMDTGKDATDPLLHMDMEIGVERVSA